MFGTVSGHCDPRFSSVASAFADNFNQYDEIGASLCIWVDGTVVVDLWGGWRNAARTMPWERDTLVTAFSVGKGMVALLAALLVDSGQLDYEARVVRYWPEFAPHGKDTITVRQLLSHQAGLPGIRTPLPPDALYDWSAMTGALAAEAPLWPPGTRHGYHVNMLGFLAGELIRRQSGQSVGEYLQQRVSGPLGVPFFFGVPEHLHPTIAEFWFPNPDPDPVLLEEASAFGAYLYDNPRGLSGLGVVNTRPWRAAQHPSSNGHSNARAIATIYNVLAHGGSFGGQRLLGERVLAEATTEVVSGDDIVLQRPSRFGYGFQLTQPERPIGPNAATFGHYGAGGSLGFADPEARVAFGYAMNRYGQRWQDPRNKGIIAALYSCL